MPNHVTNEIRVSGPADRIDQLIKQGRRTVVCKDHFTNEEKTEVTEFSLGGFIAPPEHPDYNSDGCSHYHLPSRVRSNPPDSHPNCWYVWNTANWGTKWDAYSVSVGGPSTVLDRIAKSGSDQVEEIIQFDTAWSPPFPVFKKMAELYPDLKFYFRWMDEDKFGGGGGYAKAKDGVIVERVDGINDPEHPETGSVWWQLARDLKGFNEHDYKQYLAEVAEDEGQ